MKFSEFLQHLPRFQRSTTPATARTRTSTPSAGHRLNFTQFHVQLLAQRMHALTQARTRQLRSVLTRIAAVFVPPALSLDAAAHILGTIRKQSQTPENMTQQHRAFTRLHNFLQQQPVSLQADTLQPLLMLMASCLARLPDLQQRVQALTLIEMALLHTPQLALAEALTTQLWGLSSNLTPRAFDAIALFLQQECIEPQSQIDILLELTDVMQIPSCRQRAKALVLDGLRRLDTASRLRKRIESRLALSDIGAAGGLQYRFDS